MKNTPSQDIIVSSLYTQSEVEKLKCLFQSWFCLGNYFLLTLADFYNPVSLLNQRK